MVIDAIHPKPSPRLEVGESLLDIVKYQDDNKKISIYIKTEISAN